MFTRKLPWISVCRLSEKCILPRFSVSKRAEMQKTSIIEDKIRVDNIDINVVRTGVGEHKVFLLPGLLGTAWSDFSPQISGFDPKEFTVIAWDPPGHGNSRPPERDYPIDYLERDAEAAVKLLKALDIDKCSFVGWSDGGITSLIIAAKYTKMVNKLVVWGANAFVTDEDISLYQKIRNIDDWSTGMRNNMTSIYGYEGLQQLMNKWVTGMTNIKKTREGDICREMITKINAPTLILHGAKDPLVPIIHFYFLRRNISGSKIHIFEDGKHNIHLKYAESFNKIVQSFLKGE